MCITVSSESARIQGRSRFGGTTVLYAESESRAKSWPSGEPARRIRSAHATLGDAGGVRARARQLTNTSQPKSLSSVSRIRCSASARAMSSASTVRRPSSEAAAMSNPSDLSARTTA